MRRLLLLVFLVAGAVAGLTPMAGAADRYPDKPIRLIVPYPPGGGTDLSARIMADALARNLGEQVVVQNMPGATGMIGSAYALKSPPDGYTLLWNSTDSIVLLPALRHDMPYKMPDDITFIGKVAENGMVVAVSAKLPVHSLAEFITYAKARPGRLHFGSTGIGGSPHLATLLLEKNTGIDMVHVPYPGVAPCLLDLLAGRIDFALITPITIAPYIRSDKIRMLAVTSLKRTPMLPDLPTLTELGQPQSTATVWYGLMGPKDIPPAVINRLQAAILTISQETNVVNRLQTAGLQMSPAVGAAFRKQVIGEYTQWRDIAGAEHLSLNQ